MIDQNKINEYVATMLENANGLFRLSNTALKQCFTNTIESISEESLHESFEFIIADNKKVIEENSLLTKDQKEQEKNLCEFCIKYIEEQAKTILRQQGRLT